jgi:hypothetical protein
MFSTVYEQYNANYIKYTAAARRYVADVRRPVLRGSY